MEDALLVPYLVLASLLALAGIEKLRRPGDVNVALQELQLPAGRMAARAIGLVELSLGAAAVLVPSTPTAIVLGCTYLVFALVIWRLLRAKVPIQSCGCLGGIETPPSRIHAAFNLGAAGILFVAAAVPPSLDPITHVSGAEVLVIVGSTIVAVYLSHALIRWLPANWPVTTTG